MINLDRDLKDGMWRDRPSLPAVVPLEMALNVEY